MTTPPVFSVGQYNTAAYMNSIGLWLVKTQTIGTAVSSVIVSNCFTSDFTNYRIIMSGGTSNQNDIATQIRFVNTANHFASMRYDTWAGTSGTLATNAQTFAYFGLTSTYSNMVFSIDVYNPYISTLFTTYTGNFSGANYSGYGGGTYAVNTSVTGFTLIQPSGTLTGGTIKVYGYRD